MEHKAVVFVYGTLKRGLGNFWLTSEMIDAGHAKFLGNGRTKSRFPLVCGPYNVPFLLDIEGEGQRVWGEVYAVDEIALERFDELEGTSKRHYTRKPIVCSMLVIDDKGDTAEAEVRAQAYFAHENYASRLWMKTKNSSLAQYSVTESKGYVKRKDRLPQFTFLEHIDNFIKDGVGPHSDSSASKSLTFCNHGIAVSSDC